MFLIMNQLDTSETFKVICISLSKDVWESTNGLNQQWDNCAEAVSIIVTTTTGIIITITATFVVGVIAVTCTRCGIVVVVVGVVVVGGGGGCGSAASISKQFASYYLCAQKEDDARDRYQPPHGILNCKQKQ